MTCVCDMATLLLMVVLLLLPASHEAQQVSLRGVDVLMTRSLTEAGDFTMITAVVSLGVLEAAGVTPGDSWLGIGLNTQSDMSGADIVLCRKTPNSYWVRHLYSLGTVLVQQDSRNPLVGLGNARLMIDANELVCSFTRNNSYNPQAIDLDQLYVLVAFGNGRTYLHSTAIKHWDRDIFRSSVSVLGSFHLAKNVISSRFWQDKIVIKSHFVPCLVFLSKA